MLFVLSPDLASFCSRSDGAEIEGIQNLLLAARKGEHALSGPGNIFNILGANESLSARERAMALSLANRRTELPILEGLIKNKVLVGLGHQGTKLNVANKVWNVSVTALTKDFLTKSVVLAENILDAELYQFAARHYQAQSKLNSVAIKSIPRGGGGSQIDVELKELLSSGQPVVTITDGDHCCPGGESSPVSKRCDKLINSNSGIGWHYTLPCREIENIIPIEVLAEVADPQLRGSAYESNSRIKDCFDGQNCPALYVCLKHGLTLGALFNHSQQREKEYWLNVARKVQYDKAQGFKRCLENLECQRDECACHITIGFGESVLGGVRSWLASRSIHDSLNAFKTSGIWMELGKAVFDVSVAFRPQAA